MGKKKKIRGILDAVGRFFDERPDRKSLRQAAAFEEFLEQLKRRRSDLSSQIAQAGEGQEAVDLHEDLAVLDEEIRKAERLLARLEEDEGR